MNDREVAVLIMFLLLVIAAAQKSIVGMIISYSLLICAFFYIISVERNVWSKTHH